MALPSQGTDTLAKEDVPSLSGVLGEGWGKESEGGFVSAASLLCQRSSARRDSKQHMSWFFTRIHSTASALVFWYDDNYFQQYFIVASFVFPSVIQRDLFLFSQPTLKDKY